MRDARQRCTALFICLVFASLELLSAMPGLHRHNDGADGFLRPSAVAASAGVPTGPPGPSIAPPSGDREQAPRECPACRLSGLFAVASCGVPTSVPATQPSQGFAIRLRAVASPVIAGLRGRAPPLA